MPQTNRKRIHATRIGDGRWNVTLKDGKQVLESFDCDECNLAFAVANLRFEHATATPIGLPEKYAEWQPPKKYIKRLCEEIQAGWSDADRRHREGVVQRYVEVYELRKAIA